MEVKRVTINDLEELAILFNKYRIFYGQGSDIEGAKDYLYERIKKDESVIFIIQKENEAIGFTQMYPTFSSVSMKKAWILNDLFVLENARKQGVGQLLLETAKEYAIQTKAKGISLCTTIDNVVAQRLYEKNDYVRDKQFYHYHLSV